MADVRARAIELRSGATPRASASPSSESSPRLARRGFRPARASSSSRRAGRRGEAVAARARAFPAGISVEAAHGDAAAATWIFRGGGDGRSLLRSRDFNAAASTTGFSASLKRGRFATTSAASADSDLGNGSLLRGGESDSDADVVLSSSDALLFLLPSLPVKDSSEATLLARGRGADMSSR